MEPRRRSRWLAGLVAALLASAAPASALDPPPDDPWPRSDAEPSALPATKRPVAPQPAAASGVWMPIGPAAIAGGQLENVVPATVSGAVHALAPHPTDPDILYVGAVNGGIWKTTDATSVSPSFVPLTDHLPSLSISELAFDPTDPSAQTLVAGTGRQSAFSREGGPEVGIYRTSDGGTTWAILGPGGAGTCTGVVARGDEIVASFSGAGIVRTTDAGASWQPISGSGSGLPPGRIMDLVADPTAPDRVYAALAQYPDAVGLYRSDDGGVLWSKVSDAAIDAKISLVTFNIEMAVGSAGEVWVGIVNAGQLAALYRSVDLGASWTAMDLPLFPGSEPQPVCCLTDGSPIVVSAPNHGLDAGARVRVVGVTGTTSANGDWRVGNPTQFTFELRELDFPFAPVVGNGVYAGGGTWQHLVDINPRFRNQESPAAQGQIHFAIQADPEDADIVYVGGDRQDDPFPNFIGALQFTGALVRGDAAIAPTGGAPSPQWEHLTHSDAVPEIPGGGTASSSAPHADSRDLEFDAAGDLLLGDDGGLFRRTSPRDNRGDWFGMSGNLQVTEFHSIAYDTLVPAVIGGTQDNGTLTQRAFFDPVWDFLSGGDGGRVAVDRGVDVSLRYTSSQQLINPRRRVFGADGVQQEDLALPLVLVGPGEPLATGARAPFYAPVATNAVAGDRLLIAAQNLYESLDRGETVAQILAGTIFGAELIYGGRRGGGANPDLIWVVQRRPGAPNRFVARLREDPFVGFLETAAEYPGGDGVESMAVDPDDWGRLVTVESAAGGVPRVYITEDAGASWAEITGNLGALTQNPRSVAFVPGTPDLVVVGALGGAYAAPIDDLRNWAPFGSGLPNVIVQDLEFDADDDLLVAGTLGRGAWTLLGVAPVQPTEAYVWHAARAPRRDAAGTAIVDRALPRPWTVAVRDAVFDDTALAGEAYTVDSLRGLLLPASLHGAETPESSGVGYVEYRLEPGRQSNVDPGLRPEPFVPRVVRAMNPFGEIGLAVRRPAGLLVPAAVDTASEPGAPERRTGYLCYDVKPTREELEQTPGRRFSRTLDAFVRDPVLAADCGTDGGGIPSFVGTEVEGSCLVWLTRPRQLCNPAFLRRVAPGVETTATTVARSSPRSVESLLCYDGRPATMFRSGAAASVVGASLRDPLDLRPARIAPRRVRTGDGWFVSPGSGFAAPRRADTNARIGVCVPTTIAGD